MQCVIVRSIKKQGANKLINRLRLKTPLRKVPLLGDILFCMQL